MRRTLEKCIIVFEKAAYYLNYASCVIIFCMMSLMTADVIMRYIFKSPIGGVYELVENMMLTAVACTYAWTQVKKRHVRVDVVISKFGPKVRSIIDLFDSLVFGAVIGFATYYQFLSTITQKSIGAYTMLLMIPIWPFYLILSIGMAIFFIAILGDIVREIFVISDVFSGKMDKENTQNAAG